MSPDSALNADEPVLPDEGRVQPRAVDYLWRPSYAKLWWAAIPVWWMGMAASSAFEPPEMFYDSALAGFLNILFFPLTALMVLGVGFMRDWLAGFSSAGSGDPLSVEAAAMVAELEEQHERAFEDLNATTDIYDPRSGALWIGNPLSFQYPNRHL